MADTDVLAELEALVRERMRLAMRDKVLFDRDGARLNGQLLQGEINMGAAVLSWIERLRAGADAGEIEHEVEGAEEPEG
jgi:hypothetical protein